MLQSLKLIEYSFLLVLCCLSISQPVLQAQVEINFPERNAKEIAKENTAVDLSGLWEAEITQLTWKGQPNLQNMSGKLHVDCLLYTSPSPRDRG